MKGYCQRKKQVWVTDLFNFAYIQIPNASSSDSRRSSEITGRFLNVVLETDVEDQLDRKFEKEEVQHKIKKRKGIPYVQ